MRRTAVLGAATAAALAAGSLAATGVLGSSPPRGAQIMLDPTRRQHGRLRVHRAGRPGQADRRRQLGPAGGAGGRPVLRQARSARPATTSRSTTPATASRTSPTAGSSRTSSATRTRSCTRPRPVDSINDPDLNFVQTYDLYHETLQAASTVALAADRARRPGRAGQRRARRRSPTTPRSPAGAIRGAAGRRQDVRRPGRRPVLRRPRRGLRRHQHRQARPARHRPRQPGRRQGRRRGLQHPLVRAAGAGVARSRATASAVAGAEGRATPSSASGRPPSAGAITCRPRHGARTVAVGAGQPPRQPADQRGRSSRSARRTSSTRRRPPTTLKNFGAVRAEPGAGAAPERPVQARRQGDQPHGHRPGAADRRARADPDRRATPAPADTLKVNLGVPPSAHARTASACWRVTSPASRTAAGSPTT